MTAVETSPPELPRSARAGRAVPGPPGHWLLGHLGEFREDRLALYERCRDEFGGFTALRFGPRPVVIVCDPAGIEEVLVTRNRDFAKHYMLRMLKPLLGEGLVTSEGDHWLRQRRLMQPAFGRAQVATYAETFTRHARSLGESLEDGRERDVSRDTARLTMRIAAETLMGLDAGDDAYAAVSEALEVYTEVVAERFEAFLPIPLWVPTAANRAHANAVRTVEEIVLGVVRRQRESGENDGSLLARLLAVRDEDGRGMGDRQLRDEMTTLFLAGHETTAIALAWTIFLLSRHPDADAALLAEVREVAGDRLPTADDFGRLTCTRNVLRESMRLYPPAYAFGREAIRDTELGGHRVRRGTTVILPVWAVHRDPRWYDAPGEFRPERWTPAFEARLPKYAYFPFGGGPRVCIGNTFATLEATLVLATLLARVRFDPNPEQPIERWPSATLRPRHGILVTPRRRG